MDDNAAFARLIHALRPWLGHLVIVGGWAHRLHRLHPLAGAPSYAPLRTRDVDLALLLNAPLTGDIRSALKALDSNVSSLGPTPHQSLTMDSGRVTAASTRSSLSHSRAPS